MRRVIGIGETILDIVFRDGVPTGAFPGGSVFNALVSLGRCGADTALVTETGSDRIGDTVVKFMADNGIDTRYVGRFASGQSPVSLASRDLSTPIAMSADCSSIFEMMPQVSQSKPYFARS